MTEWTPRSVQEEWIDVTIRTLAEASSTTIQCTWGTSRNIWHIWTSNAFYSWKLDSFKSFLNTTQYYTSLGSSFFSFKREEISKYEKTLKSSFWRLFLYRPGISRRDRVDCWQRFVVRQMTGVLFIQLVELRLKRKFKICHSSKSTGLLAYSDSAGTAKKYQDSSILCHCIQICYTTRGEPLMTCSDVFPIMLSKLSQRSILVKSVTSITLISKCRLPF